MAGLAAYAQEPFLGPAALQVRRELGLDVIRQWPAGLTAKFTECGIVLLHQLVEQGGFRPVTWQAFWIVARRNRIGVIAALFLLAGSWPSQSLSFGAIAYIRVSRCPAFGLRATPQ